MPPLPALAEGGAIVRFLLGFLSGLAAAWAALAIWQRVSPLGPIDAADEDFYEPRRGDRRPGFDESWPPPPVTDPAVHAHDRYCRYPARPCVCTVMHPITGGVGAP